MTRRPPKLLADHLSAQPSRQLATLLADLDGDTAAAAQDRGDAAAAAPVLPQGHHLVYFPLPTAASRLAGDGADADHAPPQPPPGAGRRDDGTDADNGRPRRWRRLWAGGDVVFAFGWRRRLRLDGRAWACAEAVERARRASGGHVVVDVRRRIALGHAWVRCGAADVDERRTLVFLPGPAPGSGDEEAARPPPRAQRCKTLPPLFPRPLSLRSRRRPHPAELTSTPPAVADPHPPTLAVPIRPPTRAHLFHFSALTFNAHAIHLDPLYARAAEGHRALLVHGPLCLALVLRVLARAAAADADAAVAAPSEGAVRRLTYRNYAPLYVDEPMTVCVRRLDRPGLWDAWVEGPAGDLAVKALAELELD